MRNKNASANNQVFPSCAGNRFKTVYKSVVRPSGCISLEISDTIDVQKEIQSHVSETDMTYILSRLAVGDSSVLNRSVPMFMDVYGMPKSPIEMLNFIKRGEDYFNSLPVDIKKKFDNSSAKWFASFGSDSWLENMTVSRETNISGSAVDEPVKEVSVDE